MQSVLCCSRTNYFNSGTDGKQTPATDIFAPPITLYQLIFPEKDLGNFITPFQYMEARRSNWRPVVSWEQLKSKSTSYTELATIMLVFSPNAMYVLHAASDIKLLSVNQ